MTLEGWLFDVYPHRDGMVVWMLGADGRPHRLLHRYEPAMYVAGPRQAIESAGKAVATLGVPVTLRPARQRELMTGEEVPVVRVAAGSPAAYPAAAHPAPATGPRVFRRCLDQSRTRAARADRSRRGRRGRRRGRR